MTTLAFTHNGWRVSLTMLIAEQQRQIEEGEKAFRAHDELLHQCLDERDSYKRQIEEGKRRHEVECAELILQSQKNFKDADFYSRAATGQRERAERAEAKLASLQSSARQMKEALERVRAIDMRKAGCNSEDSIEYDGPAGKIAAAAIQSVASLDLGPDWRKEAEKLAEAAEAVKAHARSVRDDGTYIVKHVFDDLCAALSDYRAKGDGDENA